jgi:hypothetical protein
MLESQAGTAGTISDSITFCRSKCALTYNKMIDSVEDWAEVGGEGILHL